MKLNRRQVLKAGLAASTVYSPWMLGMAQSKPVNFGVISLGPAPNPAPSGEGNIDASTYFQENGGVNGRKFEYVWESVGGDPAKTPEAFNKILTRAPDTAMIHVENTDMIRTIAPDLKRLMMPTATLSLFREHTNAQNYPSVFINGPTYDEILLALQQEIKRQKNNARVALVYSEGIFGTEPIPALKAQAAKDGTQIVLEEVTPPAINDAVAAAIAPKLLQANPDFVIMQGYFRSGEGLLLKAARAAGVKSVFMGSYFSSEVALVQQAGGTAADGFIVANHTVTQNDPGPAMETIRKFRASKGKPMTPFSLTYFYQWRLNVLAFEAFRRADAAGKLNPRGVVETLENMGDFNSGGFFRDTKFVNHRLPYTKLYRLDAAGQKFDPISDWINFT